nr:MAG: replication associated protein [Arizlama virus]
MSRARGWCFTYNEHDEQTEKILERLVPESNGLLKYLLYGVESAPTTGHKHLQGYLYCKNPCSFKRMKATLPGSPHIEAAKGSPEQNKTYCSKEGNWKEFGELPQQGKRTDIEAIRTMIEEGKNMQKICEVATSFQSIRFAEKLMTYKPMPAPKEREVRWYWGPTGTGKTRAAMEEAAALGDTWISMATGKWWDGYYGQKYVILDDYRSDFCPYHVLLRITDRYPYRVETKGGSTWLEAEIIWITSPYPPNETYKTIEDKDQLVRRLKVITEFKQVPKESTL